MKMHFFLSRQGMTLNMTDIAEKREDVEWNTQSEVRTCSECGSFDIIYDPERGEYVCGTCGLVLSAKLIDSEREGRSVIFYGRKIATGSNRQSGIGTFT